MDEATVIELVAETTHADHVGCLVKCLVRILLQQSVSLPSSPLPLSRGNAQRLDGTEEAGLEFRGEGVRGHGLYVPVLPDPSGKGEGLDGRGPHAALGGPLHRVHVPYG